MYIWCSQVQSAYTSLKKGSNITNTTATTSYFQKIYIEQLCNEEILLLKREGGTTITFLEMNFKHYVQQNQIDILTICRRCYYSILHMINTFIIKKIFKSSH